MKTLNQRGNEVVWAIILAPVYVPIILFLVWFVWTITGGAVVSVFQNNGYKQQVSNEWTLSDQSSTVEKKLEHLKEYRANLVKNGLDKGRSRFIFNNPTTDLANHMEILDSLIARLEGAQRLSPNSLEYQQALRQITTDEYQGFNTCIFAEAWQRKDGLMKYWFVRNWTPDCQDGQYAGDSSND